MSYENILSENKDGVCYITINRPKQLNALNGATIVELNKAIIKADNDNTVRCIILTGAETKAFVAGADIKEFSAFDKKDGKNLARKGQKLLFDLLENADTPSIAAINGFALGGACELAMACDIRIASQNVKFGQPEVGLGISPGFAGTQRLPRLVARPRPRN